MALNDPNWGRRGDGPPDLDEIWNRFRHKLAGLFGGRGAPREPGGAGGRRFPGGAGLLILVAVAIWLASGFYIVDASQRGVVLRFGKYAQTTATMRPNSIASAASRIVSSAPSIRSGNLSKTMPNWKT